MENNQQDQKDDKRLFHSSGYAEVSSKGGFGSTGNVSFSQRQKTEFNRRIVAGYNRSSLGMAYGALRAKPVSGDDRAIRPTVPYRKNIDVVTKNRSAPPIRKYNPFA